MTPKERRERQHARESQTLRDTEAAIDAFKAGLRVHRPTVLLSSRRTRKSAARCYGCDLSGSPLDVWEYEDVESGPSILCYVCATSAEAALRRAQMDGDERPRPTGDARDDRRARSRRVR
jgi:hypothetical protein